MNHNYPVNQSTRLLSFRLALLATLLLLFLTAVGASDRPVGLLLTWQQDPTTTMTIDWHVSPDAAGETELAYKRKGDQNWSTVNASQFPFPFSDRRVNRVEITGLEPGTYYRFRVGEFEREYLFRTMPEDIHEPTRFATGGDTWFELERMGPLNRTVAGYDPDFIVWGGDLTYADGRADQYYRWEQWFETNKQTLITDEGRVIPILASIGNHEMRRMEDRDGRNYWYNYDDYEQTDEWREENIPYYLQFFAFPGQPGYGALDFSNYLSLLLLDTDHANPIKGEQSEWLEKRLQERQEVPHVFPVYHVPGYPSHRPFDGRTETNVRENWIPLFEQYGIRVAFENHDHTYKRTHPIKSGQISQDGIVFIGDGAWGRSAREGYNRDEWYIKAFESQRHAIIVTLHGTHQHFRVINENNEVIDEYPQLPKPIGR